MIPAGHDFMQLPSWDTATCARHAKIFYIEKYKTLHSTQILYDSKAHTVMALPRTYDFEDLLVPKDYPIQFDGKVFAKMQKSALFVDPVTVCSRTRWSVPMSEIFKTTMTRNTQQSFLNALYVPNLYSRSQDHYHVRLDQRR